MNEQRFRTTSHGTRATNQVYHANNPMERKPHPQQKELTQAKATAPESNRNEKERLRNFRDLKVWQAAKELAVAVYKATRRFPQEEIYGLSAQMRRAAISISSNIAEGFNRFYKKDYQRFLMIALGSCGELESQLEVGACLGYVSQETLTELLEQLDHENRMLRKLHSKLREDQQNESRSTTKSDQAFSANEPLPLQY